MLPLAVPLIAAGVSAIGKGLTGRRQRRQARKLKESKFMPEELTRNRDLAQTQAFSRRAPGAAKAEENIRRGQANTISAIQRSSGGNVAKVAAGAVASQGLANDAYDRVQTQGQAFSENAFARMSDANIRIADQKRKNRDEFNRAKGQLYAASDQNYFGAFNDILNGAMASSVVASGGYGPDGNKPMGRRRSGSNWVPNIAQ